MPADATVKGGAESEEAAAEAEAEDELAPSGDSRDEDNDEDEEEAMAIESDEAGAEDDAPLLNMAALTPAQLQRSGATDCCCAVRFLAGALCRHVGLPASPSRRTQERRALTLRRPPRLSPAAHIAERPPIQSQP